MRPEIDESVVARLRDWATTRHLTKGYRKIGRPGHLFSYSVNDALDDLLKEVGF